MKKNITSIPLFLLLSALFFSCKKDPPIPESPEPVMPPLTHQGLNTFGCYIDGELFVANYGDGYWDLPPLSGGYDEYENKLSMQATRYSKDGFSDDIVIRSYLDEVGVFGYTFNEEDGSKGYTNWGGDKCDYYYMPVADFDHGQVTITYLNEDKNIISGTFYINLISDSYLCETGDSIMHITDGRFDFRY